MAAAQQFTFGVGVGFSSLCINSQCKVLNADLTFSSKLDVNELTELSQPFVYDNFTVQKCIQKFV